MTAPGDKPGAKGTPGPNSTPGAKTAPIVEIFVEEHEALPEGCELRFARVGEPRRIERVRYEPMEGPGGDGVYRVEGRDVNDVVVAAHAVEVDDSSAGTSTLVYGGSWGLRLVREGAGEAVEAGEAGDDIAIAEPYLLLAASEIVD